MVKTNYSVQRHSSKQMSSRSNIGNEIKLCLTHNSSLMTFILFDAEKTTSLLETNQANRLLILAMSHNVTSKIHNHRM